MAALQNEFSLLPEECALESGESTDGHMSVAPHTPRWTRQRLVVTAVIVVAAFAGMIAITPLPLPLTKMGTTPTILEAVHTSKSQCEKNFQFRHMQVAFLLDCTGSMSSEISSMKTSLLEIAATYEARTTELSMAFLCFRDKTDDEDRFTWVVEGGRHWFTDITKLEEHIAMMKAKGGGDSPEDSAGALGEALQKLKFDSSLESNFKSIIFIYQNKDAKRTPYETDEKQCDLMKDIKSKDIHLGLLHVEDTPVDISSWEDCYGDIHHTEVGGAENLLNAAIEEICDEITIIQKQ